MKAKFIEKFLKEMDIPYKHKKRRKIFIISPTKGENISITVSSETISLVGTRYDFKTFSEYINTLGYPNIARKSVVFESDTHIRSYKQLMKVVLDRLTFFGWIDRTKNRKMINFFIFFKNDFFNNIHDNYLNRKDLYSKIIKVFKHRDNNYIENREKSL